MENRQFEAMLAVAQERLAQHAPEDIAGKTGAQYADGSFLLKTLGQTVTVRLSDCTIQPPLSKWHELTLLHYLDLADGAPLTGRTITFSQYKDGLVRGGGLDRNAELIVRRDLGILPPEELERRCRSLGTELFFLKCDLNCCLFHKLLHSTKSRHTVFTMCLLCVFVLYGPMLCAGELVEDQRADCDCILDRQVMRRALIQQQPSVASKRLRTGRCCPCWR